MKFEFLIIVWCWAGRCWNLSWHLLTSAMTWHVLQLILSMWYESNSSLDLVVVLLVEFPFPIFLTICFFQVKYVLENCTEDLEFFDKFIEPGLIQRLTVSTFFIEQKLFFLIIEIILIFSLNTAFCFTFFCFVFVIFKFAKKIPILCFSFPIFFPLICTNFNSHFTF